MISILCPTRGRPKEFLRMVESAFNKATNKDNIEVVAYIDNDDSTFKDYPKPNERLIYVQDDRIILTDCWNQAFKQARGDIHLQGNDDVVFRTPGWDIAVEQEFENCFDKILLVHGSDEGQHFDRFGAHSFVHRRWIEAIGYFIPPWFVSDFGDTWINEVAGRLNRRKYISIVIEHLHFLFKKAPMDKTYEERLERHRKENPDALYCSKEMCDRRQQNVEKLRRLLNTSWK